MLNIYRIEGIKMETTWEINTYGDPLGSLVRLVDVIWKETGLDGILVSSDMLNNHVVEDRILDQPEQLTKFNPFRPAMRANSAAYVPGILREKSAGHYGAVLRPCEMRALDQLEKLDPFPSEHLLTICVDCLGTFPAGDLEWRTERRGSADGLASDTLKFARQGGISVDRYRPACQICRSSGAEGGDVNIWVIGLPARQVIMVNVPTQELAGQFRFANSTLMEADNDLLKMRQRVLDRVATRNQNSRDRFIQELIDSLPATVEAIAEHLEQCGECRECLDACPICSARNIERGTDGHYNRQEIAQWLAACSGCGMCEQACIKNIPLSAVFGVIHEHLQTIE
jgi:formate dehydrogenase subunit beta